MAPKEGKQKVKAPKLLKDGANTLPKDEVVRMLNDLRYNSSEKCRAEESWKNQCAKALQVYKGLNNDKKHDFLKAFLGAGSRRWK